MTDEEEFLKQKVLEIEMQKQSLVLQEASKNWMQESIKTNYSYHFEWLGRPIIQYPQDMIAVQQLLWRIQPDLIIETGIARGGSLIFYASILELISQCGGPKDAKILGIDDEIGSLEKGKEATFFISSGDALDIIQNNVENIFIKGEVINLENHQSILYKKYKEK